MKYNFQQKKSTEEEPGITFSLPTAHESMPTFISTQS
jgi:hypothetical protein